MKPITFLFGLLITVIIVPLVVYGIGLLLKNGPPNKN